MSDEENEKLKAKLVLENTLSNAQAKALHFAQHGTTLAELEEITRTAGYRVIAHGTPEPVAPPPVVEPIDATAVIDLGVCIKDLEGLKKPFIKSDIDDIISDLKKVLVKLQ